MNFNSLKNYVLQFIKGKYPEWVNGGEVERLALDEKYKASNASRRLRELHNEGRLERRINPDNKSVEYLWKVPLVLPREEEEKRLLIAALL